MPRDLPYPGYSWPLNHHIGPVLRDYGRTMYELLFAAFVYSGHDSYQERITEHIVSMELLPPNIRDDAARAQVWRDYQQVLAELGCIFSTRFTTTVEPTPVGLMWLDGNIGFSELITTQALRYQYPNGHKQDISPQLKRLLRGRSLIPTLTELDTTSGVQMKPAVLLLRVLLQLLHRGNHAARLTTDEVLTALVPIPRNEYWEEAIANLDWCRGRTRLSHEGRRRRHIQEWFRLLSHSDIFHFDGRYLTLSEVALADIGKLIQLCEYHENADIFWIPTSTDPTALAISWFNYYGNPNFNSEWLQPLELLDSEYLERNYPGGLDESENADKTNELRDMRAEITLRPIDLSQQAPSANGAASQLRQVDQQRILAGLIRRRSRTRLHENIVKLVASRLRDRNYQVMEDPSSVDLLAAKETSEAIIEVKTVTSRNLSGQMRLGVGQLCEYRYRRQTETQSRPLSVLVLSSSGSLPEWLVQYFQSDIHIGLVGLEHSNRFRGHTQGEIERALIA